MSYLPAPGLSSPRADLVGGVLHLLAEIGALAALIGTLALLTWLLLLVY
ncbi:MAG: hypothetical protein WB239_00595 [Acidimicrobiia bacterium]